MIRSALLASCLVLGAGSIAAAQDKPVGRLTAMPASNLLRMCQSAQTVKACEGYVSGISDGITLVETAAGPDSPARKVCIPAASGTQLRGMVVAWMSKHQGELSGDVGPVVYKAFADTFPCKEGAGGKP